MIVKAVKDRVNNRSLWIALEAASGVTIEGDTLIIGLAYENINQTGHLNTPEHRNAMENAASELAGRPLRIRLIEGNTLEDWEDTKRRDARVAAKREATYARRDAEAASTESWDGVFEYAARAFSALPSKALPQSRARYLTDMLYVLADTADQLLGSQPDETAERQYARVLDRVAINAEVPAALVAMEVERLRAWRQSSGGSEG
jgi:hypothetical protein